MQDSQQLLKRLEDDLSAASANNVRESQRQALMDLGRFHYDRGDFMTASKAFMRSRDRCSSARDTVAFCAAVIRTYAQLHNWPMVTTYVSKAEGAAAGPPRGSAAGAVAATGGGSGGDPSTPPKSGMSATRRAQMSAAAALADLATARYNNAALHFAAVGPSLGTEFSDVVTGADVARLGALCALASCDRAWIRNRLLGSATFAMHLESFPEVRRLLVLDGVHRGTLSRVRWEIFCPV